MRSMSYAALIGIVCQSTVSVACPVTNLYKVNDKGNIRTVKETAAFVAFRSVLRVNTDGAANSYHPIGKSNGALNSICNGIAVYPSSGAFAGKRISSISPKNMDERLRCQTILDIFRDSRNSGYAVPKSGTIDWYALAMEPGTPPPGFYRPCIQSDGAFKGFFVAQTAKAADQAKSVCDPAHWLSSTQIPYITLPTGSKAFKEANVKVGDLALVHRRVAGKDNWIAAVVADLGNSQELGEGSIALHHALGNPTVVRIPNNLPDDVTTFVFKNSAPQGSISEELVSNAKVRLVDQAGGMALLKTCL